MPDIASITVTTRYKPETPEADLGKLQTGEDLRMTDGSLWFHPYSGAAPRQIEPAQ